MGDDDPTPEEMKQELKLLKALNLARAESDRLYAIKLVERIVFGMVAVILLAVLTALVALVVAR